MYQRNNLVPSFNRYTGNLQDNIYVFCTYAVRRLFEIAAYLYDYDYLIHNYINYSLISIKFYVGDNLI